MKFHFLKYSLFQNKFEAHWIQRILPIHDQALKYLEIGTCPALQKV